MATTIKRKDVDSLAAKLEGFAKELPEQEQQVLGWILTRAEAAEEGLSDTDLDQVAGGQTGPLSNQLASLAGFGSGTVHPDDGITVSWNKTLPNSNF